MIKATAQTTIDLAIWKFRKTILIAGLIFALSLVAMFFILFLFFGSMEEQQTGFGDGISEIGANEIPAEYLPIYRAAQEEFGVPWNLIAAVHKVETNFSTIDIMESYMGAIGHFQFMDCTWIGWAYPSCGGYGDGNIPQSVLSNPAMIKKYGGYGLDGNGDGIASPWDLYDAAFSAANLLAANGAASGDYEGAVFEYNHDTGYVRDVLNYAQQFVNSGMIIRGSGEFLWPVPFTTNITSPFGMRIHPITNEAKMHSGIDIAANGVGGKPIVAIAPGKVIVSDFLGGYGNVVFIDHGNGITSRYAHMKTSGVPAGKTIRAGAVVGYVGSTGDSTGDHLHFEVRVNGNPVDPAKYYQNVLK
ncbi:MULTISPECIES: peptidoglycan DD-metalloendopeptidase family protein [Bacillota]|uniref:peptidoglycan DD-metalloendopeptidase family protein n=1 Tax=Bacillota TaxID=1239 RepID=UPI0039EE4C6E